MKSTIDEDHLCDLLSIVVDRWPNWCRLVANYVTFYNLQAVGSRRLKKVLICDVKINNVRMEGMEYADLESSTSADINTRTVMARLGATVQWYDACNVIYVLCREDWVLLVLSIYNNHNHLSFL